MGNPTTPEGKAQLERQSPLNSAQKIKTPLLVAQGANDPRVKKAEAEQIVIALRDRGFPVEYLLAPDEGHGFARPVNNMALWAASEKFFAKHLGGRFQESMTPEVAKRLTEITVDPKTVVLTKKVDAAAVGTPRPTGTLDAGVTSYKGTIAGRRPDARDHPDPHREGRGRRLGRERRGEDADGRGLRHHDPRQDDARRAQAFDQAGAGRDRARFRRREGERHLLAWRAATPKPIAVDLGGELFADGAGADAALALLPLAEGYTVSFRNVDLMRQKVALKQLKVVGQEEVSVARGHVQDLEGGDHIDRR